MSQKEQKGCRTCEQAQQIAAVACTSLPSPLSLSHFPFSPAWPQNNPTVMMLHQATTNKRQSWKEVTQVLCRLWYAEGMFGQAHEKFLSASRHLWPHSLISITRSRAFCWDMDLRFEFTIVNPPVLHWILQAAIFHQSGIPGASQSSFCDEML